MKKLCLFILFLLILNQVSSVETGDACQVTDDCPSLHSCTDNICVHKPLFPITAREVIGTIIILTMNALLTAGGVGGGAAYVPYIMLLFVVDLKKAIAYAYACVFGGGIGNLANIIFLKNPKTKRYMINYDINLVLLPALMSGVLIGAVLQRMFPPLVTNIILILVLAYSLYRNSTKLKQILKKEKQERNHQKSIELAKTVTMGPQPVVSETPLQIEEREDAEVIPAMVEYDAEHAKNQEAAESAESQESEPMKNGSPKNSDQKINLAITNTPSIQTQAIALAPTAAEIPPEDPIVQRRHELEQKELKFPFHKLGLLLINAVIVVVIGLIRGTKKFDPIVGADWSCWWDFLWFGIALLLFAAATVLNLYFVNKWQKEKIRVGYEFLHEEPQLNRKRIISLLIVAIVAGIIGAIVALGGALIISPSLLEMGMPPAFCAATTGVVLVFSMFNTMFQTILNKRITGLEIAWFIPLAIVFSYISSKVVNHYVRKTGKQSIILILMVSITFAGFGCVIYNLINGMIQNVSKQTTFTSIC